LYCSNCGTYISKSEMMDLGEYSNKISEIQEELIEKYNALTEQDKLDGVIIGKVSLSKALDEDMYEELLGEVLDEIGIPVYWIDTYSVSTGDYKYAQIAVDSKLYCLWKKNVK